MMRNEIPSRLHNPVCRVPIGYVPMVFQILLHHLVRYHSCTPCSIPNCPKVPTPVPFPKCREFLLQQSRTPPLQPLHQVANAYRWRIFHMHVYMVFAYHSLQNVYILAVAYLHKYIPTSLLYITCQHCVSIFCNPNYMTAQITNTMRTISVCCHVCKYTTFLEIINKLH